MLCFGSNVECWLRFLVTVKFPAVLPYCVICSMLRAMKCLTHLQALRRQTRSNIIAGHFGVFTR